VRNHIINLLIVLFILPATLFAGTLFEEEKKTSDPYVGERGGFNSLFVNPAGAAGQSGFELSANVGARSTSDDIKLFMGFIEAAGQMGVFNGDTPDVDSIADAGQNLSDLYSEGVIDNALLDSLFGTTALDPDTIDWSDPAAVEAAASSLTPTDITTIETNGTGVVDGTNSAFFAVVLY
jgi:hypothetical protein